MAIPVAEQPDPLASDPAPAGSECLSPMFAAEHAAAEHPRKVTVVSFGLFGHQGVFRREATSAAQIVANRFGGGPVVVKFNSKTGGDATNTDVWAVRGRWQVNLASLVNRQEP